MTTIPDALPFLGYSAHSSAADGACAMEYLSVLAGEEFGDSPKCTDHRLGMTIRNVNDALADEPRQELLSILHKALGTNTTSTVPDQEKAAVSLWQKVATRLVAENQDHPYIAEATEALATADYYLDRMKSPMSTAYWYGEVATALTLGGNLYDNELTGEDAELAVSTLDTVLDTFRRVAGLDEAAPIELPKLEALRLELVDAL